ncbi:hypothetical protein [Longibacter sp.]|uniref:Dph6-related ATP pyrophosphatase n=1 Tax=Longibacter sp. TaxID=2045415 RepID=UPI003EBFD65F
MPDSEPVVALWSGGKDAMWMLETMYDDASVSVSALLTTVVEGTDAVTTHGTPLDLIRRQADRLDLPLHVMRVPPEPSNETYEAALERSLAPVRSRGITTVAAGDLHLEEIRSYRENLFRRLNMSVRFPIWGTDPDEVARHLLQNGTQAIVVSVDTSQLDGCYAGRRYDQAFLDDLPDAIDACGENGEFHTFVSYTSSFGSPIAVRVADIHGTGRMRYARLEEINRTEEGVATA